MLHRSNLTNFLMGLSLIITLFLVPQVTLAGPIDNLKNLAKGEIAAKCDKIDEMNALQQQMLEGTCKKLEAKREEERGKSFEAFKKSFQFTAEDLHGRSVGASFCIWLTMMGLALASQASREIPNAGRFAFVLMGYALGVFLGWNYSKYSLSGLYPDTAWLQMLWPLLICVVGCILARQVAFDAAEALGQSDFLYFLKHFEVRGVDEDEEDIDEEPAEKAELKPTARESEVRSTLPDVSSDTDGTCPSCEKGINRQVDQFCGHCGYPLKKREKKMVLKRREIDSWDL